MGADCPPGYAWPDLWRNCPGRRRSCFPNDKTQESRFRAVKAIKAQFEHPRGVFRLICRLWVIRLQPALEVPSWSNRKICYSSPSSSSQGLGEFREDEHAPPFGVPYEIPGVRAELRIEDEGRAAAAFDEGGLLGWAKRIGRSLQRGQVKEASFLGE